MQHIGSISRDAHWKVISPDGSAQVPMLTGQRGVYELVIGHAPLPFIEARENSPASAVPWSNAGA